MNRLLQYHAIDSIAEIELPFSKSESNRLLIAQALSNHAFEIKELSDAEDTVLLKKALTTKAREVNVGMAGTAFRFLTAYFALQEGEERVLTGAERMKERPIGILVEQLRELGAEISYLEKDGYPPLKINGKALKGKSLKINASISSQYITALLLIAPYLKHGIELSLEGHSVSLPYIDLTIALQRKLGVCAVREGSFISVKDGAYTSSTPMSGERDWSSAAFFYQWVALNQRSLVLKGLTSASQQGDSACVSIFRKLGVETIFNKKGAILQPIPIDDKKELLLDLTACPDLIPSVAVCASQLIDKVIIEGTQTLYIKESNRVEALKNELKKLGITVSAKNQMRIEVQQSTENYRNNERIQFCSYNDHRIAMCLAPLVVLYDNVSLDNASVVEKSFPSFWKEFRKLGVTLN